MTMTELMSISDACKTDTEFLENEEVRRAYWQALDKSNGHKMKAYKCSRGRSYCTNCGNDEIQARIFSCLIPGSLADAAEALRAKVAERQNIAGTARRAVLAMNLLCYECDFPIDLDTPRQRLLIFVAALGAVEVP